MITAKAPNDEGSVCDCDAIKEACMESHSPDSLPNIGSQLTVTNPQNSVSVSHWLASSEMLELLAEAKNYPDQYA